MPKHLDRIARISLQVARIVEYTPRDIPVVVLDRIHLRG